METITLMILMGAAFAANFFSVITGGAGLIMTPLLITFGLPPIQAIAAAKFSNLGTSITGTVKFHKEKRIDYKLAIPLSVFGVIGAIIGPYLALKTDPSLLKIFIAFMMLGILAIVILNRNIGESDHPVKLTGKNLLLGGILITIAVILGTLAGGGIIVLLSYILVIVFGESFLHSAGTQKIVNDVAFIVIAVIFIIKGVVDYSVAIPLLLAASLGGWFGASYGIIKGEHWVKNVFIVVIVLLSVKLVLSF